MHVTWLGNTGFKIQVKPFDKEVTILIDPYKYESKSTPRNLSADVVLFTRTQDNSITLTGEPFILETAGECETKDVLITSTQGHNAGECVFRIDTENMSAGHLGLMKSKLNAEHLSMLSNVDILFVPVGGKDCFSPEEAAKVVTAVQPRIIIPMASKSDIDPDAAEVSQFVKHIGLAAPEAEKKAIIKQKNLPQEDMQLIILTKE